MEELLPIISISINICIFVFAFVRLTARYNSINQKHELFSLLWLTLAASFCSASIIMPRYVNIAAVMLLSGFSCYTLILLRDYTGAKFYTLLLKSTGIIMLFIMVGLFLFNDFIWWNPLFTAVIIILYSFLTFLFVRHFISGLGRYYRAMCAVLAVAVVLIILNTSYTILYPAFNLSVTQLGVPILILAAGTNTLDRSNLVVLHNLNSELHRVKEQYENETENIEDVVISLARTIDAKDKYTEGHIERVSQYAAFLGERIGLDENTLDTIRIGALIHDIGKICVDLNVLHKPAKLSNTEFEQIKQHPILGEQICSPLKALRDAGTIVRCHHEKLDGSGYPDGLTGESISLETRIVTIADIFDALTTERSYRKALSVEEALVVMQEEAFEGKLDKDLVNEFFDMLAEMEILSQKYIV